MPREFTNPSCPRSWWTSLDCTNYCECFFCTCSLLKSTRFRERFFHRRWLWMTWRSFQGCLKREEDLNPATWKQFRGSDKDQQKNSEWCNAKFSYRATSARVLLPTSWGLQVCCHGFLNVAGYRWGAETLGGFIRRWQLKMWEHVIVLCYAQGEGEKDLQHSGQQPVKCSVSNIGAGDERRLWTWGVGHWQWYPLSK